MNCRDIQENLSAYLDGETTPQETESIRAHLASCAACTAELDALRRVVSAVKELPELRAPAGLRDQVMARLTPAGAERPRRNWVRILWPAAAALTIAVLLKVFYTPEHERMHLAATPAAEREHLYDAERPATPTVPPPFAKSDARAAEGFADAVHEGGRDMPVIAAAPSPASSGELRRSEKAMPREDTALRKTTVADKGAGSSDRALQADERLKTQQAVPAVGVAQRSPDLRQTAVQAEVQAVMSLGDAPVWFIASKDPAATRDQVRKALEGTRIAVIQQVSPPAAPAAPAIGKAPARAASEPRGVPKPAPERYALAVSESVRDRAAAVLAEAGLRRLVAIDPQRQTQWAASPKAVENGQPSSNVMTTPAEDQILFAQRAQKDLAAQRQEQRPGTERLLTLVFLQDTPVERAGLMELPPE